MLSIRCVHRRHHRKTKSGPMCCRSSGRRSCCWLSVSTSHVGAAIAPEAEKKGGEGEAIARGSVGLGTLVFSFHSLILIFVFHVTPIHRNVFHQMCLYTCTKCRGSRRISTRGVSDLFSYFLFIMFNRVRHLFLDFFLIKISKKYF